MLVYVFDYGFPAGFVESPSYLIGTVTQNGEVYEDGFDEHFRVLERAEEAI